MTGFGKASRELDGDTVVVEVNAVNHRFLDVCMHLPAPWGAIEPAVKETVRKHVTRGRLNVWAMRKRQGGAGALVQFDSDVARQYVAAARGLAGLLGTTDSLSLDVLAQLEGVFYQEEPQEDLERVEAVIVDALDEALAALNRMRETEGQALAEELRQRIEMLRVALGNIEARLPEIEAMYLERLRTRLEDLEGAADVTEERLAVELALLAEKGDVTEEVVRLRTHMGHALELLDNDGPAGRELNFLIQELQREVHTLGAKVRDSDVALEVLRMKAELEKFREQTQNIE